MSALEDSLRLLQDSEGEDELYKVTAGPEAINGVPVSAGIWLFAQSVPVYPYTLAVSSSLALHGVPFSAAQSSVFEASSWDIVSGFYVMNLAYLRPLMHA